MVTWRSLRVWRVLYSCVTVREGSPQLLYNLLYGNTFLGGLHNTETRNQTFGEKACHPERSEGSGSTGAEILRFAQDDSQDTSPVRLRQPSLQTSDQERGRLFSSGELSML
jgi:hypothetical protein